MQMGATVLVVMALYLVLMLCLGFFFKSKVKTFDDFILGGQNLPWFVISMTMLATLANAQQTLGIAGNTYLFGFSVMIWFFLFVNMFIYPIIVRLGTRYRALNFSTIVDLAEERFKGSARLTVLLSIWQVAWALFSTGICLFGGAVLIQTVFGVSMWAALLIVAVVTVFYCIMGGLNAVVFTDLVQWLIIVVGTAILIPAMYAKYGSFSQYFSSLLGPDGMAPVAGAQLWPGFTDLFTVPMPMIALFAMGIAGSLWIPIDLGFMQRMLAAKNTRHGRLAALMFLVIVTIWATLMVAMGLYARQLFPDIQNTDTAIILVAQAALPSIGVALFVTAIAAAVMSTVSTYLNAGAAILAKNIYKRFVKPQASDGELIRVAQVCVALIAVGALAFAPMVANGGVFATAVTIQMVICASLTPMIIMATLWKRMSERASFWGSIVSGVLMLAIVMKAGGGSAVFTGAGIGPVPAIFIGLAVSIVIYVAGSLATPYDPSKVGQKFLDLFDGKVELEKVKNTDLIVIGVCVVLMAIFTFAKGAEKVRTAFPPLAGIGGFLTDAYFVLAALAVFVICVVVLVKSIGWVKELNASKKDEK
ncbi:MAG: sodium:solute symporter family protein [Lachnospiraceae bacterium]|jgi:SSS family solute:Na+ symporter|nr:sodium:solute symporter family protein [Lachnospiraceae bacterium]